MQVGLQSIPSGKMPKKQQIFLFVACNLSLFCLFYLQENIHILPKIQQILMQMAQNPLPFAADKKEWKT